MITDQCIWVKELQENAMMLIKEVSTWWPKYIFVNNKPVAMLVDINNFSIDIEEPFHFDFWKEGLDAKEFLSHFE